MRSEESSVTARCPACRHDSVPKSAHASGMDIRRINAAQMTRLAGWEVLSNMRFILSRAI